VVALGLAVLAAGCASSGTTVGPVSDLDRIRAEINEMRLAQDLVAADLARVLAELRSLDARTAEDHETLQQSSAELTRLQARVQAAETALQETKAALAMRPAAPPIGAVVPAPPPRPVPIVAVAVPVPVTPERAPRPSAASERPGWCTRPR
jgi:multidrug efflux pump subunit AcrA (membrane-fusion protein)